MSRILAIADPHLTDKPLERYRHAFMDELLGVIDRRKPDAVAILGDLTQEKDHHSAQLVNEIVDELRAIADRARLIILPGNHDYMNEGHPFFEFLKHMPNVDWVRKPERGDIFSDRGLSNTLWLPHTRTWQKDWEKWLPHFASYDFVFTHQTFNNAEVGFGRKLEGIPVDEMPKGSRIVSGDVHVPQVLQGIVTYVGAPYTMNFGDDYNPRLLMLDTKTKDYKSISVKAWPQKRFLELQDLSELPEDGLNAGDIVKVRIGQDDMGNWPTIHAKVVDWAKQMDVILFRAEPILTTKSIRKRVRVDDKGQDDASIIKTYGKRHGLTDEQIKHGIGFTK